MASQEKVPTKEELVKSVNGVEKVGVQPENDKKKQAPLFRVPSNRITVTSPPADKKPFLFSADIIIAPEVMDVPSENDDNTGEISKNITTELVVLPDEGHYLDDVVIGIFPLHNTAFMAMAKLITADGEVEVTTDLLAGPITTPLQKFGPLKGAIIRIIPYIGPKKIISDTLPVATVIVTGVEKKGLGTTEVKSGTTEETVSPNMHLMPFWVIAPIGRAPAEVMT